jgi:hypothetical protein
MAPAPSLPDVPGNLDRSPKKNWVEKAGGLPPEIEDLAKHLHYQKGMDISRAIATAVNVFKRMCATGDTNWPGIQHVKPSSRAKACAAVAEWEAKRAKAKATK